MLEQEKGIYVYTIKYYNVALAAVLCDFAKQWSWDRLHFISMDNKFVYSCVFVECYQDKICNVDRGNVS